MDSRDGLCRLQLPSTRRCGESVLYNNIAREKHCRGREQNPGPDAAAEQKAPVRVVLYERQSDRVSGSPAG